MPAAAMTGDRRRGLRVPTALRAEFRCAGRSATAMTVDLSTDGLFLHTDCPAIIGDGIMVRLPLGDPDPLRIVGTVVRLVRPGEGALPGLGVRFEAAYARERETVEAFVSKEAVKLGLARLPIRELPPSAGSPSYFAAVEQLREGSAARPASPPGWAARPPVPKTSREVQKAFDFWDHVSWRHTWSVVWKILLATAFVVFVIHYCVPIARRL